MYKKPASLRSDKWPTCPGLGGRFPSDWVAGITGISKNNHDQPSCPVVRHY